MDDAIPFPGFSAAQVRYLETVFPNRCAQKGMALEDIWMEAGAQRLIQHIKSRMTMRTQAADLDLEAEAVASMRHKRRR